jgi:hypothetical protein
VRRVFGGGDTSDVRGCLQFLIEETLGGGVVASRKLGDVGRGSDALEGNLGIKF